ncbi:MAG TPA: ATP-dependent DNA helicase, partial [Fimbriimonadaceae bacterium]|nr:ATP-dependent DNA helicase [Fimbriimonadaceae bacterium]
MSTVSELIEGAFRKLAAMPGFTMRGDQRQLALLLSDMIGQGSSGAFEAPTGLGKSLAALVPAIAHALVERKRTIIATYTNVLAEQYWRSDLPLALSLFDLGANPPKAQFLIGRQRYACLAAIADNAPELMREFVPRAELGIETELRQHVRRPARDVAKLWPSISAPPVCPGRLCSSYNSCFYYKARRLAEDAEIVITNHSVVIQDALLARASDSGEGMLGDFDFLILDEAHDFPQAAINGLEFELSQPKLASLLGVASRMEKSLAATAEMAGDMMVWAKTCEGFRLAIERCQRAVIAYSLRLGQPGILKASPAAVMEHPQVQSAKTGDGLFGAQRLAEEVCNACVDFTKEVGTLIESWREKGVSLGVAAESVRNYLSFIREYGAGCYTLFTPEGVSVSYVGRTGQDAMLRSDMIGLAEPLTELIWDRTPYACLSATLALDGTFDFFRRTTGALPAFEEVLPSPFDFASQAAIYLPKADRIPDPSTARKEGREEEYYQCLARELTEIITVLGGRTLALFHSRKEMEGVMRYMMLPPELPILMQFRSGAGSVGEQFVKNVHASLFALRSFWTGFDAPGETLSCVALVRVPFEVPIDPPQIARMAWMQTLGLDPFQAHTLPQAKMLMRQGAGRLIRRAEDKGIIALLDPRLRTKRYGEEILANLPSGMRAFDDFADAAGSLVLDPAHLSSFSSRREAGREGELGTRENETPEPPSSFSS